jgi:splicing factor 45
MGYREGHGLGKSQQGMSSALIVEKTSKRGGKIVHEKEFTPKGNYQIRLILLFQSFF